MGGLLDAPAEGGSTPFQHCAVVVWVAANGRVPALSLTRTSDVARAMNLLEKEFIRNSILE
jgi:hypothetical protein